MPRGRERWLSEQHTKDAMAHEEKKKREKPSDRKSRVTTNYKPLGNRLSGRGKAPAGIGELKAIDAGMTPKDNEERRKNIKIGRKIMDAGNKRRKKEKEKN